MRPRLAAQGRAASSSEWMARLGVEGPRIGSAGHVGVIGETRMPNVRNDVWKLGPGWPAPLLWYAKGVGVLQARPIADPTSWLFLAAMHGIDEGEWKRFGYLPDSAQRPSSGLRETYWDQCQHQSWYFLPWHRGYLAAFESIVRAAIVSLQGPSTWALPYWDYSRTDDPNVLKLPGCFGQPQLPDGSKNPLFVSRRYGPRGDRVVEVEPDLVTLGALTEPEFTGVPSGSTGFGGVETGFLHGGAGRFNGQLESQPHNNVHGLVGGQDANNQSNYGLMSSPDTAALDPIFWLHHANIDRLWEVWLRRQPSHHSPSGPSWSKGPTFPERTFVVPTPAGAKLSFSPLDMLDTSAPNLDYVYEDTSDPLGGADLMSERMERLGVQAEGVTPTFANVNPPAPKPAELMGANDAVLRVGAEAVSTTVRLDEGVREKVFGSLLNESVAASPPDRVFLNLENIRGKNDAAILRVYVNLPSGAAPAAHPEHLVGSVSLFGVRKSSKADSPHGGSGISQSIEITKIIDSLHLEGAVDVSKLDVRLVPATPISPGDEISVSRVSVYRQGS